MPPRGRLHEDHDDKRRHPAEVLYFVPPTAENDPCPVELWVVRLANTTEASLVVQTFSYVELSFLDAYNDLHNLDWGGHIASLA